MSRTRRRHYKTGLKTLRDGKARGMNWSEPSWFHNLCSTRPWRRATRHAERRVMHCPDAADGINWPLPRKPHVYFW